MINDLCSFLAIHFMNWCATIWGRLWSSYMKLAASHSICLREASWIHVRLFSFAFCSKNLHIQSWPSNWKRCATPFKEKIHHHLFLQNFYEFKTSLLPNFPPEQFLQFLRVFLDSSDFLLQWCPSKASLARNEAHGGPFANYWLW